MKECSKSIARRIADPNFINKFFVGRGIDIGGMPDPLSLYKELFCQIKEVITWDWEDGDAQFMTDVADDSYDFVHSSHCLEHLAQPQEGLMNWLRIVRPGGFIVITVPDEDLYEQGIFPSTFNKDHKWTFTIFKHTSWSRKSLNVVDMVRIMGERAELIRLEQLSSTYRFDLPRFDQTLTPVGECGIEFVIRKRPSSEVLDKGRWRRPSEQPSKEVRLHLNQYQDDMRAMKQSNAVCPPFMNDNNI